MKRSEARKRTLELVQNMSTDEISYAFGRYCGRGNEFLSQKKYGFVLDAETIQNEVFTRQFEESITQEFEKSLSETPDKIEE